MLERELLLTLLLKKEKMREKVREREQGFYLETLCKQSSYVFLSRIFRSNPSSKQSPIA